MTDTRRANRLINEKSPYLLQHAYNPVDWQPWSDDVLDQAREEDRPIFLSIGYSTCHWCHVMAHESFEDEAIAAQLNRFFIPVKVDREERPDLDRIYMTATQAMTGSGGWPLSVFLLARRPTLFRRHLLPAPADRRPPELHRRPHRHRTGLAHRPRSDQRLGRADHRLSAATHRPRPGRGASRRRSAAEGPGRARRHV